MIEVKMATPELIQAFYGHALPYSMRSLVAVRGDEVLGVIGIYPQNGQQLVFFDMKDELRQHPRVFIQGAKTFMRWVRETKMPTCARCDGTIPAARRFLEHFGFRHLNGGVFVWIG